MQFLSSPPPLPPLLSYNSEYYYPLLINLILPFYANNDPIPRFILNLRALLAAILYSWDINELNKYFTTYFVVKQTAEIDDALTIDIF